MEIEEIKELAIQQLSKETNIADYFIRVELEDDFVKRCIEITKTQQSKELEKLKVELNQCHKDKAFYSEQWEKQSKRVKELELQERKREYKNGDNKECPYCKSENIQWFTSDLDMCGDCKKQIDLC